MSDGLDSGCAGWDRHFFFTSIFRLLFVFPLVIISLFFTLFPLGFPGAGGFSFSFHCKATLSDLCFYSFRYPQMRGET